VKALLEALKRWVKFPKPHATETTCVICGCTDSRGCPPASCYWSYGRGPSDNRLGKFGLCSKCDDERLCELGKIMAIIAVEDGQRWKPKKTCPCPLCEASRKEKP
jgi:hypothetical protein